MSNRRLALALLMLLAVTGGAASLRRFGPDVIAWYDFDAGNGRDRTGRAASLTFNGDASVTSGYLLLDGSGDYASAGSWIGSTSAMSVSAWFYTNTLATAQPIANKYASATNQRGWVLNFRGDIANDPIQVYFQSAGTAGSPSCSLLVNTAGTGWWAGTGAWHHIVAVMDVSQPVGSRIKLYVNGQFISATSSSIGTPTQIYDAATALQVGGGTDSSFWTNGRLDDVVFHSRALATDEIRRIYESGR